jgi:hypothetical protein
MVHFPEFARTRLCIQRAVLWVCHSGFPHSEISGSTPVCGSPKLIAACHVLLRLFLPRHPPCALSSLTIELTLRRDRLQLTEALHGWNQPNLNRRLCNRAGLRRLSLHYPKDTQLNNLSSPAIRSQSRGIAQPCNVFYPIDFVVKHPVAGIAAGYHPGAI